MSRCVNAGIDNVAFLPEAPQKRLVGASSDSHRTVSRRHASAGVSKKMRTEGRNAVNIVKSGIGQKGVMRVG